MTLLSPPTTYCRGGKEYRRWTKAHKRSIVEETFAPGASVSVVARRHDVNANQVFMWLRLYERGELGGEPLAGSNLVPVGVIGPDGGLRACAPPPAAQGTPSAPPVLPSSVTVAPRPVAVADIRPVIILSLAGGAQLRIDGDVGLPALRCALKTALGHHD